MEQGFLGPKPEAQWSLREAALVHQIAGVSEGRPVVGPQHQTSRPERGRAWPKVTRRWQGQEDGRLELSLLLPDQLPLPSRKLLCGLLLFFESVSFVVIISSVLICVWV